MVIQPLLIAFAGPNGAGKSTLQAHLFGQSGIPFINADEIAKSTGLAPYAAAEEAESQRQAYFAAGRSFIMETVLSDPVGAKVAFLHSAMEHGYWVEVHFVGLASAALSAARVFSRVMEGGHDVPDDKIASRYARVMENLTRLAGTVSTLTIYDNSDDREPYRVLAHFAGQELLTLSQSLPAWIAFLDLPSRRTAQTADLP